MLTEVDTRDAFGREVTLYIDSDAQVYLVAVEGFPPVTCMTRGYALTVYRDPFPYLTEGAVSPPNATGGSSPTGTITDRTSELIADLANVLRELPDADFHWYVGLIGGVVRAEGDARQDKPFDGEEEIEF